jgi:ornithine lipid ester-linked acyl 2-hydroxylase
MFYDIRTFPFVETLERNFRTIRGELEALTQSDFHTYRNFTPWKVFIFRKGFDPNNLEYNPENCARCPETTAILDSIPGVTSAAFSRLLPGTHLWPHRCNNTLLRCHLGLVIVDGCAIRVGGMVRSWEEGKCLAFSARQLHEAWNRNTQPRTVLLFDVNPATLGFPLEPYVIPKTPAETASGLWLHARYLARKNYERVRAAMGNPVVPDHTH